MKNKDILLYPEDFNELVNLKVIDCGYRINTDISKEKDSLRSRIKDLNAKVDTLNMALETAKHALSRPSRECAACRGDGTYWVGTGVADSYGNEETMVEVCDCMVDKEAFNEIELS